MLKNDEKFTKELQWLRQRVSELEVAMHQPEERFFIFSEVSTDGIFIHENGNLIDINPAFERMFGYARKEACGLSVSVLTEESRRDAAAEPVYSTAGESREAIGLRKDGTKFVAEIVEKDFNYLGCSVRVAKIRDITELKKAEAEQRNLFIELENLKLAIDEHSLIAITDQKGIITYVNDKFIEISKYSSDELLGKDHRMINSSYHPKAFFKEMWDTIKQGKVWKGQVRNKAKDGSFYWMKTMIFPFLNDEGEPHQFFSIRTDITEQKRIEELQRDVTESILQSSYEGIVMTDLFGEIIFANERMKTFFQKIPSKGEPLMRFIDSLSVHVAKNKAPLTKQLATLLDRSVVKLNERFWHHSQDNETLHFELYANPVFDELKENERGYLFVFRNRTEEEQAEQLKNEFVSIVSHELRTPLASVLGFIEILLHRQQLPADKQKKYMETIYREATRLSNLINDFLDLQRMESGSQECKFFTVDVAVLAHELAEQWQGKQTHQIHVHLASEQIFVRGDEDSLRQVMHNLLSNATKYSPGASKVDIFVRHENNFVYIDIQDYGLGIPDEAKNKLFSKFFRVDNSDRRQIGGTGLGLAICKEIISAHHGKISFHSEMGKGSIFTIQLAEAIVPNIDGTIVILEDDCSLVQLYTETLEKLNIPIVHLRSAEDAILALHNIREKEPLLYIVDILLEGKKTGWDFITEMHKNSLYNHTPVLVSSAFDQPYNYLKKPGEKYLKKPFTIELLMKAVKHLLHHYEENQFIFPYQDEKIVTSSLEKNGFEVNGVVTKKDMIRVKVKKYDQKPQQKGK